MKSKTRSLFITNSNRHVHSETKTLIDLKMFEYSASLVNDRVSPFSWVIIISTRTNIVDEYKITDIYGGKCDK